MHTVTRRSAKVPLFEGTGRIGSCSKEFADPGPGELLLQVRANAICGSDRLQFKHGSAVTPGHETAGVVIQAGPSTRIPVGSRGVVYLMDFCGTCRWCVQGGTQQCARKRGDMGFTRDGGYGPYELISESMFFEIDSDLEFGDATLLLDVMGTGGHACKRAQLLHRDIRSIAVTGAGPIGLGALAMAKLLFGQETKVAISDVNDYRLKLAEKLGGIPIHVSERVLGEGLAAADLASVDLAIDTTGRQEVRQACMGALSNRGILVCVGHGGGLDLKVSRDLIASERAVLGSEYFEFSELRQNQLLLRNHLDYVRQIITHRIPVAELQQGLELFFEGRTGKVVVEQ